eukprot:6370919-Amphidinium_carterae.2
MSTRLVLKEQHPVVAKRKQVCDKVWFGSSRVVVISCFHSSHDGAWSCSSIDSFTGCSPGRVTQCAKSRERRQMRPSCALHKQAPTLGKAPGLGGGWER